MTGLTFDIHIFVVLLVVLGLIALDFLVGVLTNLSTFSIQKFPAQLANFVLPYFTPLLVLAIVQFLSPVFAQAGVNGAIDVGFYTAASAVGLKALADILGKVGVDFPSTKPAPVVVVAPVVPPANPAA